MVKPLDRYRRDSTLFQFTAKRLRDFIDPAHLLIQIDERGGFAKLVQPSEMNYSADNGSPAIHAEVLVRACSFLHYVTSPRSSVYVLPSQRKLPFAGSAFSL